MKTLSRFVAKFTNLIVAVLSCFDRVIFKGYPPITNGPALEGFVDHILKIRRCDFMDFAEGDNSYPFGRTILAEPGRLGPGLRVTGVRENHLRAMSSGPGPNATRYRENHNGWNRTANEPPVAARLVARTIPTAPEGQPFRRPILSATRCQRRHVLLLEEACP